MMMYHLISISIAFLIDAVIGDPPNLPHPVKWMGSFISYLERKLNHAHYRKEKGVLMVCFILLTVLLVAYALVGMAYSISTSLGITIESLLIATTISRRSLRDAALAVYEPLHRGEINEARLKLSYIVGRDTDGLDEKEIVRGTVETVAENTTDGVTAPLFWALIGGAPFALMYRAINTCDSMVGYKNDRYAEFGWASARLDDVVNFIPSRVTGFIMIFSDKPKVHSRKRVWAITRRDARKHPSPNSGWTEAAVAGLLGIALGGLNTYQGVVSRRATMGEEIYPLREKHILQCNKILRNASLLFILVAWLGGIGFEMAFTWIQSSIHI